MTAAGIGTYAKACIDENLTVDTGGLLRLARWSVPRLVADVIGNSGGDGLLYNIPYLPGRMLINLQTAWVNDAPVEQMLLIRVTRGTRAWVTSNPNAVQFRDRWTTSFGTNTEPDEPITSGIFNSQCGGAVDLGTNTVAEPNPGVAHVWMGAFSSDEWVGPVLPNEQFRLKYRAYVWTPPPFSDNANKNSPQHGASAGWARVQLIAWPGQGTIVTG